MLVARRPFEIAEARQKCGTERSRQMVPALAPIHARPAEGAALPGGRCRIDAQTPEPLGHRFILREERTFLEVVDGTFAIPSAE
jgi:hypothetical protein